MKLKHLFGIFAIGTILLAGCSEKYDDTEIKGRLDKVEEDIKALQAKVDVLTTQLTALAPAVEALQGYDYITDVETTSNGYILTFKNAGKVTVFNGTYGYGPQLTIKKDETDGEYYWAINGEFVTDGGVQISINDTPEIRLVEGKFYLYLNNTQLEEITDANAGSFFKVDDSGEDKVSLIFNDGTSLDIPKVQPFRLNIDISEAGIFANSSVNIPYTITAGDAGTKVTAIAGSGYSASVTGNFESGTIRVTAPVEVSENVDVLVVAVNGDGVQSAKILTFEQGVMTVAKDTYTIGAQGGEISIELKTNVVKVTPFKDPQYSWLNIVENPATKAIRDEVITLSVDKYENGEAPRVAIVTLNYGDDSNPETITVTQLHQNVTTSKADLNTFENATGLTIHASGTSAAGWTFEQCLVSGPGNWDQIKDKTINLSGATDKTGILTSPLLEGGCRTLTLVYGSNTSPGTNKLKFKVEIKNREGLVVETGIVEQQPFVENQVYNTSFDFNVSGDFTMVFTNLCPSGKIAPPKRGTVDPVILLSVEWTDYVE